MKGLLKNLGLILILVGAIILVACSFTGNVNNNSIQNSDKKYKRTIAWQSSFYILYLFCRLLQRTSDRIVTLK